MHTQHRRFIFADYDNLVRIRFKKLEKVSNRLFIFVNSDIEEIPFSLARQMQKLGRRLKWIPVENPKDDNMNYHIAFLMGKLHQKVHQDVEFAILSNDKDFDSLISYINTTGRSCIRVKRKKTSEERAVNPLGLEPASGELFSNGHKDIPLEIQQPTANYLGELPNNLEQNIVDRTAEDTIQRLIRSGNRPADISMLKSYILLHNEELALHEDVEKIIHKLEETREIEISKGDVTYNF